MIRNRSRHEGTVYYVISLRDVYRGTLLYSSDASQRRNGNLACLPARYSQRLEHVIPWGELVQALPGDQLDETFLAVELEIWTPLRLRARPAQRGSGDMGWSARDLFQSVELMHNPSILLRPPTRSCFISYAWRGRGGDPEHAYRSWVYRLADALSRCGLRPIIDYNFLAPADINRDVIERCLETSDAIVIVYSDGYFDRIGNLQTGVGFEYELIRSRLALWEKSIPIRRGLRDRETEVFAMEPRLVDDFEGEGLAANAAALADLISARIG